MITIKSLKPFYKERSLEEQFNFAQEMSNQFFNEIRSVLLTMFKNSDFKMERTINRYGHIYPNSSHLINGKSLFKETYLSYKFEFPLSVVDIDENNYIFKGSKIDRHQRSNNIYKEVDKIFEKYFHRNLRYYVDVVHYGYFNNRFTMTINLNKVLGGKLKYYNVFESAPSQFTSIHYFDKQGETSFFLSLSSYKVSKFEMDNKVYYYDRHIFNHYKKQLNSELDKLIFNPTSCKESILFITDVTTKDNSSQAESTIIYYDENLLTYLKQYYGIRNISRLFIRYSNDIGVACYLR